MIAADRARSPRLRQSKRLAGGEDVIHVGSAVTPLTAFELIERRLQVVGTVIRPEHLLKHQFGVCGFPQKEVG